MLSYLFFVLCNSSFALYYIIIFSAEEFPHDESQCGPELLHSTSLSRDIQGAPPGSFVHHLGEIIGSISSVHKMAFFWQSVVVEVSVLCASIVWTCCFQIHLLIIQIVSGIRSLVITCHTKGIWFVREQDKQDSKLINL